MKQKTKKSIAWIALPLSFFLFAYLGYTCYRLTKERDGLVTKLEGERYKFSVLQKKYGEQKAQFAVLQRSKLAAEGALRQAQQAEAAAEEAKLVLEKKVEEMEAECRRRTAALENRTETCAKNIEALKENRDQYKTKLAETVQIVKERNDMIYHLTSEKDLLTITLQEKTSILGRCEKHNGKLVELSDELVTAYENKGMGTSLLQGEPFTKIKKVEIEKYIQLYRDRIDNDNLDLINQSKP